LNRDEAVSLLNEIQSICDGLNEQSIALMPPNANDVLSKGYQLHIKTNSHAENVSCFKPIVDRHNLAIADEPDKGLIVIYRPMTSNNVQKVTS
jgi:hypothetical protein